MKYYTMETTELKDGTYAQSVYIHNSYDEAVAKFHEFMHYQMIAGLAKTALCMVISEQGVVDKTERWEAPVVQSELSE